MKRLHNIEEYKEIVRQAREKCQNAFSNNYFMPGDVRRYIEIGKAYYESTPCGGYLLLLDEEKYYRVCMYVDATSEFTIPDLDKKAVIKNVYRKGKEEACLADIEKRMADMSFRKEGTVVQVSGDVAGIYENCKRFERFADKLLRKGYQCVAVDDTYYDAVDKLMLSGYFIRDYQIDYRTSREKEALLPGSYLCILNEKDEICAVSVSYIEGAIAYGEGILIEDAYKMQGLAQVLMYHRFKWLFENQVQKIVAWILVDNEVSMRYHTGLGYQLHNKYVNEWVRYNED
ncbi:MAG: GNAT family N-acetyltransferase [Lachnospiraceae bacterium]|nr:GNAT family N-acetyltransferase [Lachnospiraceae bacterium]